MDTSRWCHSLSSDIPDDGGPHRPLTPCFPKEKAISNIAVGVWGRAVVLTVRNQTVESANFRAPQGSLVRSLVARMCGSICKVPPLPSVKAVCFEYHVQVTCGFLKIQTRLFPCRGGITRKPPSLNVCPTSPGRAELFPAVWMSEERTISKAVWGRKHRQGARTPCGETSLRRTERSAHPTCLPREAF